MAWLGMLPHALPVVQLFLPMLTLFPFNALVRHGVVLLLLLMLWEEVSDDTRVQLLQVWWFLRAEVVLPVRQHAVSAALHLHQRWQNQTAAAQASHR